MESLAAKINKQPVYSAFLSCLIVAAIAVCYVVIIKTDTSTYYMNPQVKGTSISRPVPQVSSTDTTNTTVQLSTYTTQKPKVLKKSQLISATKSVSLISSVFSNAQAPTTQGSNSSWNGATTTTRPRVTTTTRPRTTTTKPTTTKPTTTTTTTTIPETTVVTTTQPVEPLGP